MQTCFLHAAIDVADCVPVTGFDMMTGNANIYIFHVKVRIRGEAIFQCSANGLDGFINVKHLAMFNAIGVGFTKTKYLKLAEFVLTTGNYSNLSCPNVKTDDNG